MFLSRQQLGSTIEVVLQCKNGDGTPGMPTEPPMLTIRRASDGVAVYTREMPIAEKQGQAIGLFIAHVFLGSAFNVGEHNVQMAFTVGSFTDIQFRSFKAVSGGHPNGHVMGMAYFRRPSRNHVIYQVEAGSILRGSNPRIN